MEHEPLLGDKRKGYRVSMWLHLQLIPLGVLSWKEKKTSVRSILSETCTEDLGCSINEGKTTLLDDSFRLEKQTFGKNTRSCDYLFNLRATLFSK